MQTSGSHHLQADELPTVSTGGSYYNHDGRVSEHLTADWRTAGPGRILVIENDKALQKIIRRILVSEGYEVELVSNGTTGLELVRQKTPSALIVDLQFPGSPGCDLCRELLQAAPAVPFVVLSACPSIADKVLFLEVGADD
jgi:CheY-like chemotaxis protein